jgi:hypothetical protein
VVEDEKESGPRSCGDSAHGGGRPASPMADWLAGCPAVVGFVWEEEQANVGVEENALRRGKAAGNLVICEDSR